MELPGGPAVVGTVPSLVSPHPGAGAPQRGSVVTIEGSLGSGATTLALRYVARVTAAGEWAVWVGDRSLGVTAAAEAGVVLGRLAVVDPVPEGRWATVVAGLLEAAGLVVAEPKRRVRPVDARRLRARVRERRAVLMLLASPEMWPERLDRRVRVSGTTWRFDSGYLGGRTIHVEVADRGHPMREEAVG